MAAVLIIKNSSNLGSISGVNPLLDTTLSRQIKAELLTIEGQIKQFGFDDYMTNEIREWHRRFSYWFTHHQNKKEIFDKFASELQKLLKDPLTFLPFDEQPLLGSDGHTYGRMALSLQLRMLPEEFRKRSPLNIKDETPFTTKPHLLVKSMLDWLKSHNLYVRPEHVELEYKQWAERGLLPPIPSSVANDRQETIRALMAAQAERERKRNAEEKRNISDLTAVRDQEKAKTKKIVEELLAAANQRMESRANQTATRIKIVKDKDDAALKALQEASVQLKSRIENHEKKIAELEAEITKVDGRISEADRQNKQLERDIAQAERALMERESNWITGLLTTVGIVGGCMLATYLMPQLLASMGASGVTGTAVPVKGGGLLSFSFAI